MHVRDVDLLGGEGVGAEALCVEVRRVGHKVTFRENELALRRQPVAPGSPHVLVVPACIWVCVGALWLGG